MTSKSDPHKKPRDGFPRNRRSVLFLIPSFVVGGAELQVKLQIEVLESNGFKPYLCILSDLLDDNVIPRNLDTARIWKCGGRHTTLSTRAVLETPAVLATLITALRKTDVGVIVANLPLGHHYGRLLKICFPTLRLVTYHHSLQYSESPLNSWPKRFFNGIQVGLARFCDNASIFVSHAVYRDVKAHMYIRNYKIIYNFVYDQYYELRPPKVGENFRGCFRIILPGRLHPAKGQAFFLRVFQKALKFTEADLKLVIAGGGAEEALLKSLVQDLHLKNHVTFTGTLTNSELLQRMSRSDLVVIPSIHEGLGIVAIEAAMLGKPVLASETGGLPEVVSDGVTGKLFPVLDSQACFSELLSFVRCWPCKYDRETIRSHYRENFSPQNHLLLLRKVLNSEAEFGAGFDC